jgi:hypothetical protein
MSTQAYTGRVKIEWDDSIVIVFSFTHGGTTYYTGFTHVGIALQNTVGTQTQISNIVQTINQNAIQVSADPQTWVETVKSGSTARNGSDITIVYDDTTSIPYTTQTAQPFQLQILYSICG